MKGSYLNDAFFSRLETLALNLRADLTGFFGGKHLVKTYGQTVEFADYREYMLGDDIRRIDWNLYSRFEKFFLKLFTDERQMHVHLFLDCSASMGKVEPTKGNYAVAVAAALGFLAVHNMDKTSFKLLKGSHVEDPFGTIVGKNTFFKAISQLENLQFEGDSNIADAICNCPMGSNDGLAVIISDFFSENDWKKAIDYLTYKRKQVLLVQIVTQDELDPIYSGRFDLIDSEAEELMDSKNLRLRITPSQQLAYQEALADIFAEIEQYCVSRGAGYLRVSTDQPLEQMLFSELLKVGIME